MCGISGIFDWGKQSHDSLQTIKKMVGTLGHRGPDGRAIYIDDLVTLGHSRLSIIDPEGGRQPLCNEDGSLWLTCNGEIFNYIELRRELIANGHHFSTDTDVEVLIHLFEDHQENLFKHINGQYAFAIWDSCNCKLFLGRDHVGICPLYYWSNGCKFAFASEIKALFQLPWVKPRLNLLSLIQTFTFWSPLPGESPFHNIFEIKPGCYMWVESSNIRQQRYWGLNFTTDENQPLRNLQETIDELTFLLEDAVKLRLRSDVPVGAYLSGGLDSSIITALIKNKNHNKLRTFSVGFESSNYDETEYQQIVSKHLCTDHSAFLCNNKTIVENLSDVIWHTEKPILRTSPAPLYLLSKKVNDEGYKVVLTGEGADEFFSGYNIYKETKIRYFNAKQPESKRRALLFKRLYPYLDLSNNRNGMFWQKFFTKNLQDTSDPFYSHRIRWQNSSFLLQFISPELLNQVSDYNPIEDLTSHLNSDLDGLSPLSRAHFIEAYIFLGSYLLSSQGDRMLMSHSVEGRYPYLDTRVIDFANNLPYSLKLKGLNEKWILKKTFANLLPPKVVQRNKQPYRAPIKDVFHTGKESFEAFTSDKVISQDGIFQEKKVAFLKKKFENPHSKVSEREEMALVAILTTEMFNNIFINRCITCKVTDNIDFVIFDKRSKNNKE